MTAALDTTMPAQSFDWRSQSACDTAGADRAYDTAEDLVERGLPFGVAQDVAAYAVAQAKRVCASCPVRAICRDTALREERGELGFGVWGAMAPEERVAYRPTWLKIKKINGVETAPTVHADQDSLHVNTGVNSRYRQREARIRAAKDRLLLEGTGFVLDTGAKYGRHGYAELMKLFDMVLANPSSNATDLAERIGASRTWFNDMIQRTCEAMGV
jgi:hypothetical protein